jgi:hypothetical protein
MTVWSYFRTIKGLPIGVPRQVSSRRRTPVSVGAYSRHLIRADCPVNAIGMDAALGVLSVPDRRVISLSFPVQASGASELNFGCLKGDAMEHLHTRPVRISPALRRKRHGPYSRFGMGEEPVDELW